MTNNYNNILNRFLANKNLYLKKKEKEPHFLKSLVELNKYHSKLLGFNGKIPKGRAFVGSGHSAGFDSRYFGFVNTSLLKKAVVLL